MSSNAPGRMLWMDATRGIAIVLVVLWHAVSLTHKEGLAVPDWALQANLFFMPYRMPTLMFLSGLLLASSLRKPLFEYYEGKIRLLVWPYLIWAAIYMMVMGSDYPLHHPRAWFAVGHLWFLFFIAVYYFVAPLLRRVPVWATPLVMLLASVPADGAVNKLLYFGVFFFLGHAAYSRRDQFERILGSVWMPIALVPTVAFGVYAMFGDVEFNGLYAPLNVVGILCCIWLIRKVENRPVMRPFRYIGRDSIVFYVSHIPVIALLLAGAKLAGITEPGLLIPAAIAGALLAGWVLSVAGRKPAGRWMFAMPRIPTKGRVSRSDGAATLGQTRRAAPNR